MAILRSQIEKKIDELKSHKGGMEFQNLAVVLAKQPQRWPELIASGRWKDLGYDAYASAKLSPDGIGKALIASITANLDKISDDAKNIKKHLDDVKVLIFATTEDVTNTTARQWASEISKEFGYQLLVMPREEIITSLMDPNNAPLCRSFGIPVPVEPDAVELVEKVRAAASKLAADRVSQPPLAGKPLLPLSSMRLDDEGRESGEILQLDDIKTMLTHSRRIVLEAPAGRGKTTTLVQLADQYSKDGDIAILVDLPVWIMSGKNILEYVAGLPHFRSQGVDAGILAKVYDAKHITFLLNGWNEISDNYSERALVALQQLERTFPSAGIIVATRTHHLVPPLPGALRAKLLRLNRSQRIDYIERTLTDRADELCSKLNNDPVLDELTQTPLILSGVTEIFEAGRSIQTNKIGILNEVMGLMEESTEHRGHLQQPPLRGHAQDYLYELAAKMIERTEVMIPESEVRPIIKSASAILRDAGQIASVPEPQEVINDLCAHHVLEREDYPSVTFRFEHQQFQEYFAAIFLKKKLWALLESGEKAKIDEFTSKYVNEPMWAEPLRMIAEEIGANVVEVEKSINVGKLLIEMALSVDPIFAADLARLCGAAVWKDVGPVLSDCLRKWYKSKHPSHRRCALAGMMATGSSDFNDIILPLLTREDRQVRLAAYHELDEFHLSTLGPDWQNVIKGWEEEARIDFATELMHQKWLPEVVEYFLLKDPSVKVRTEAIRSVGWVGSVSDLVPLIEKVDQESFECAIQNMSLQVLAPIARGRALVVFRKLHAESKDPVQRLRLLIKCDSLRERVDAVLLKDELEKLDSDKMGDLGEFIIKPALEIIKRTDPEWVSHWVVQRIIEHSLSFDSWSNFISVVAKDVMNRWLWKLANWDFKYNRYSNIISVLALGADGDFAMDVSSRLYWLERKIAYSPEENHKYEHAIIRQLSDLFRALPPNAAVAGLSTCFKHEFDGIEFTVIVDLFSRAGRSESALRDELDKELRQKLRTYLKGGLGFVLSEDDYCGDLKADLATSLAEVGDPEDMEILHELIQQDIKRIREGMKARERGDRTALANGAINWKSNWHVRAVMQLDSSSAENVFLELLHEPEYAREAASMLVKMATGKDHIEQFGLYHDYGDVWRGREGKLLSRFDEERRKRYATAVSQQISDLLKEYKAGDMHVSGRLLELTRILAILDPKYSVEIILEVLMLPIEWHDGMRADALQSLLFAGVILPTEETISIFDNALGRIRKHGYNQSDEFLFKRYLCLLPFVDDPTEGLKRMHQAISEHKMPLYELRDVMPAMGQSRCEYALHILRELAGSTGEHLKHIGEAWINAVASLDTPESRRLLLSFVDQDIKVFPVEPDVGRSDVLAARIAELALRDSKVKRRLVQLCNIQLMPTKRMLLAEVMAKMNTTDSIIAGLNLMNDSIEPGIPYSILRQIEANFVEHRPLKQSQGVYTLVPSSANEIRKKLFEMVTHDSRRKRSALALLGKIEAWRLDYGRPTAEPRHPDFESGEEWPSS